jgi:hypothetical protein
MRNLNKQVPGVQPTLNVLILNHHADPILLGYRILGSGGISGIC